MARSIHKVFSGAGCGKTTKLVNEVLGGIIGAGVSPDMIVFTTFTRKGAEEARTRTMKHFNLPKSKLPWFRTCHSLALHFCQDMGRVMGPDDWLAIAKKSGERLTIQYGEDFGRTQGVTRGDRMLALWNKSRLLMRTLAEVHAKSTESGIGLAEIEYLVEAVQEHKKGEGCVDFTDILEEFLRREIKFTPSHVLVDEFQDTSPLQWEVIKKLATRAELWMAGDDDQCIYEYAGAVPDILMDTPGYETTLPMSHRLPKAVHELAQRVTTRISKRVRKNIGCRRDEGLVQWITEPCLLDMSKGTWMLLVRNNCFAEYFEEACARMGLPYTGGSRSIVRPDAWKAVRNWMRLERGEYLDMVEIKKLYSFLYQNEGYTRGFKSVVAARGDDEIYDLAQLRDQFGLIAQGAWSEVFKRGLKNGEREYLMALDAKGELDAEPRIHISTIHGVKGGEADNVVLLTDMTQATHHNMVVAPDTEHRVWYVAVTRARNAVHAVRPLTNHFYDLPL